MLFESKRYGVYVGLLALGRIIPFWLDTGF